MSQSEVITILILFHMSGFKHLKGFYLHYVKKHMQKDFPKMVSYNRFTELQKEAIFPLALLVKFCCPGKCTGISFVDSTRLKVCHNKRIRRNKVFKGVAAIGKSTMGWFYGFKLHLMINDRGELLGFTITKGNVDDRTPLRTEGFLKSIFGKLFADKGYISKKLFNILFVDGVRLITAIRNNTKNSLMSMADKMMLRKRSVIETVNDELKNICQIEHSRHRSIGNFFTNILAALAAYSFFPEKRAIKYETIPTYRFVPFSLIELGLSSKSHL